jgi:hypothetical protein
VTTDSGLVISELNGIVSKIVVVFVPGNSLFLSAVLASLLERHATHDGVALVDACRRRDVS